MMPTKDPTAAAASLMPPSLRVIGLAGGVASGKSLVARQLAEMGAGLLDADRAGHEVLGLPEIEAAARDRWGDRVFSQTGRIDRGRLAGVVFAPPPEGPRERRFLENLTHPEIGRRLAGQAAAQAAAGVRVAILDAPLILEAGWDKLCSRLLFVDAPRRARLARAVARGWTEEEFAAREAVQLPLDQKRRLADFVVDNSGPPEETQARLERLWPSLVE
jgi:dephospho-CoA kinase